MDSDRLYCTTVSDIRQRLTFGSLFSAEVRTALLAIRAAEYRVSLRPKSRLITSRKGRGAAGFAAFHDASKHRRASSMNCSTSVMVAKPSIVASYISTLVLIVSSMSPMAA